MSRMPSRGPRPPAEPDQPRQRMYSEADAERYETVFITIAETLTIRDAVERLDAKFAGERWSFLVLTELIESPKYRQWREDYMALKREQAMISAGQGLASGKLSTGAAIAVAGGRLGDAMHDRHMRNAAADPTLPRSLHDAPGADYGDDGGVAEAIMGPPAPKERG